MNGNKSKKKSIALFLLLIVLSVISLTGCIGYFTDFYYDSNQINPENVSSIDIYDFSKTPEHKYAYYQQEFEEEVEEEVEHALSSDQIEPFLTELAAIKFRTYHLVFTLAATDPSFRLGDYVVRINFSDGSFRLISDEDYNPVFDSDGKIIADDHNMVSSSDEWNAFISKYLPASAQTEQQ